MPRPGPRPYECVRRAWHSDRHQPMRGSIIQQIFRVVHESHSSATRKNKEWQEKLPIVVLKAEEIMYSKANSEVEYMDLQTLWDRVNDAIDTIIRKDETTETGDHLPPCVEVRASRSQRQANPRSYLSPRTEESGSVPPKILDNTANEQKPQLPPLHPGNQLSSARPLVMNSTHLVTEFNRQMPNCSHNNPSTSCKFPLPRVKVPSSSNNQFVPVESNTSVNMGSVYPLHYGADFRPQTSQFNFEVPKKSNSIIVGGPVFPSIVEPTKMSCLQNLPSCEGDRDSSSRVRQADFRNNHEKASETGFDLSLRLGLFKDSCLRIEKVTANDTSNVDLSSSQEGNMFSNLSPHQNKEFAFFPVETANDSFGFHTSQRNFEGEGLSAEAAVRKRKSPFSSNLEDGQFFSQPQLRPNQFTSQAKRPCL